MQTLRREVRLGGAVMMGLGSIVGTGVFVSIGIAAGIAGPALLVGIVLAALVAGANGMSSAQLAANHPVSGGTYEYGYRFLSPVLGFTAGWMFLVAKSASAATAALGFSGYLLEAIGLAPGGLLVPVALAAILVLAVVVLTGIRRSSITNIIIVSVTLLTLLAFIVTSVPAVVSERGATLSPFFANADGPIGLRELLFASALLFVAYTGYGRIATLGEEVTDPRRTIPRAIVTTLIVTMILYVLVGAAGVGSVGAGVLSEAAETQAAPLEVAARRVGVPGMPLVVTVGAVTAMLGVLLNLLLGLSRVLLAMGRRMDMPAFFARLDRTGTTPTAAVVAVAVLIGGLALIGDVRTTWSFSAFTVLIYYAITNLAALFIPPDGRIFPKWISVAGLIGCVSLAAFVEPRVLAVGLAVIALGIVWHLVAARLRER
ncbi:MAG: amino acid permease [Spirochaetes bacterium]|jgi:APA family basic amino acid/polyamine antiporter|nr:amino acid permease [Spirochaetota bacterium]